MSSKRCAVGLVWLLAAALVGHAHAEETAPNQPQTYYVIPIKGVIGRHITAGRMEACLKEAERLKPNVVVLELNTGGGDIYDAERIVDLIIGHKEFRFVAFVQKALSAGATITLACEKIFVSESATIGGAVSYSVGTDGMPRSLPADVAEKFQSVWRAVCRKAAEHGGHPSLLAEAMVDPAFALTLREEGGKPVFERDGRGKVLKAKGRILTLTAREAVECTLAEGVVPDLKAVGRNIGMPDWREVGGQPGVQSDGAGGPAKSASDACATPDSLYEMLYDKVVSLGMTGKLTQLQEKKASEDWTAWFDAQHLVGSSIQWNITLLEAAEGEMRLVPEISQRGGRGWIKFKSTVPKLAGSIKSPRMGVEKLGELLADVEYQLKNQQEQRDRGGYDNFNNVMELLGTLDYLRRLEQETQRYPIKVTAKTDNEPRVFHIAAWVGARSRDALARVPPETQIALSGKIGEVVPYLSEEGIFLVEIILDQCELTQKSSEPRICPFCKGSGRLIERSLISGTIVSVTRPCEHCKGTGKIDP